MNNERKLSQFSLRKLINTSKLMKIWTFLRLKKTFLERCDNDLNLDRQTDRWTWWETKTQLSLEYCRASPRLLSHSTACPPSPPFQNNSNSVFKCVNVCVCVWEKVREKKSAGRGKEWMIACVCAWQCVYACACMTDRHCTCMCVSDVKDCHCVRGETPPPFTKRSLSSWISNVLRENLKR